MSGGLSRRAATLAPAAIADRSAASRRSAFAACAVFGASSASAVAATGPAQPIRLVAPNAPGGTTDLAAPTGTPTPVVSRLNRELNAVLATRGRLAEVSGQAGAHSPEEYTAFIRSESAHWEPLVPASGATAG